MPEEVKAKALVQLERLEQQHPFSPEIGVIRGYLDWLIELPWAVETEDQLDLAEASRVLGGCGSSESAPVPPCPCCLPKC
jgi:ATP-dependent Lon protease